MALDTNLTNFVQRAAQEDKSLRTLINGNMVNLSALTTVAKNNLVAAINEVAAAVGEAGATIDDATVSTLSVWSSNKTNTEIAAALANIVGAAPATLDTLTELSDALGDDPNFASTVIALIGTKVGLAGDETVAGIKTFSSAPAVPDNSFTVAKVSGLQAALNNKLDVIPDPGADRIRFWDDSAASEAYLSLSGPLSITGTALSVAAASATVAGIVELATDAEANTGTDTTRAITPANLRNVVGDPATNFVTIFEAALAS